LGTAPVRSPAGRIPRIAARVCDISRAVIKLLRKRHKSIARDA